MNCCISGVVPQHPVVSTKSGHVFEKSLIEKHLQVFNKCPVTGEDLALSDLMPLVATSVPEIKPVGSASLPGMLQSLQNEWDSVMLETHQLKTTLHRTRQELARALYENDACYRVIARLISERDTAVNQLKSGGGLPAPSTSSSAMEDEDDAVLPSHVAAAVRATGESLQSNRPSMIKERAGAMVKINELKEYQNTHSVKLHKSSVNTVAMGHDETHNLAVTGGDDKTIAVYDVKAQSQLTTLTGHKKGVNSVAINPVKSNLILSASTDNTARVWSLNMAEESGKEEYSTNQHTKSVVSAVWHPSGDYFATASADKSWAFYDAAQGDVLRTDAHDVAFTALDFHPDGAILALAADKNVLICDIQNRGYESINLSHDAPVTDVTFSQNGKHLASADKSGIVKYWDLRSPQTPLSRSETYNGAVSGIAYDNSGTYCALACTSGVNIVKAKKGNVVSEWTAHTKAVMDVAWSTDGGYFVSVGKDKQLCIYTK